MDQRQHQHRRPEENDDAGHDHDGVTFRSRGGDGPSDALRAESERLMNEANEGIARANAMDDIVDAELATDHRRFLNSIHQTSGQ